MTTSTPYPTLREVARALQAGYALSPVLRVFLTYLNGSSIQAAITEEPASLAPAVPKGAYYDAYLAALAEYLAAEAGCQVPAWTASPARKLDPEPQPAPRYAALHELLKRETPDAFRRHGLVISSNALTVA